MLFAPDQDLSLADCWGRIRFFTELVRREDFEPRAHFQNMRDPIVVQEVDAAFGGDQ